MVVFVSRQAASSSMSTQLIAEGKKGKASRDIQPVKSVWQEAGPGATGTDWGACE